MNGKFPDLSQSFHSLVPTLHPEEWPRKQGLLRLPTSLPQGERQLRDGHGRAKFKTLPSEGEKEGTERGMEIKSERAVDRTQ